MAKNKTQLKKIYTYFVAYTIVIGNDIEGFGSMLDFKTENKVDSKNIKSFNDMVTECLIKYDGRTKQVIITNFILLD